MGILDACHCPQRSPEFDEVDVVLLFSFAFTSLDINLFSGRKFPLSTILGSVQSILYSVSQLLDKSCVSTGLIMLEQKVNKISFSSSGLIHY